MEITPGIIDSALRSLREVKGWIVLIDGKMWHPYSGKAIFTSERNAKTQLSKYLMSSIMDQIHTYLDYEQYRIEHNNIRRSCKASLKSIYDSGRIKLVEIQ